MADETVLTITDEAIAFVRDVMAEEEDEDGELALAIEVTGIKWPAFAYELSFIPLSDARPDDMVERHEGLAVVIPTGDTTKLSGATLAMSADPAAPGLTIDNPNRPGSPTMGSVPTGELSGPLAEQVRQVLELQVNPAIAAHGGAAELVSVEDDTVYLRMMGGCQGCGMAQVTLRHGIERILLEAIPELVGVVDVTDHASGDDPYYESAKK